MTPHIIMFLISCNKDLWCETVKNPSGGVMMTTTRRLPGLLVHLYEEESNNKSKKMYYVRYTNCYFASLWSVRQWIVDWH